MEIPSISFLTFSSLRTSCK